MQARIIVAIIATAALSSAAWELVSIERADIDAHGRLAGLERERSDGAPHWPWRVTDQAMHERQYARRLGLTDGKGSALVELLPPAAHVDIAKERADAIAENRLHALVRRHGRWIVATTMAAFAAFAILAWSARRDPRLWPQVAASAALVAAIGIGARVMILDLPRKATLPDVPAPKPDDVRAQVPRTGRGR